MSCDVYKGRDFTLLGKFNAGVYGALPTGTALRLKFSTVTLDRAPVLNDDPTIIPGVVLLEKQDEIDETPTGSLTTIACMNETLYWMKALFGAPVSTGTAPNLIRTFTMNGLCKPDMLLELYGIVPQSDPEEYRVRQFLGGLVNTWEWDLMAEDQSMTFGLIMARQVRPFPTDPFDIAPTMLAKQRAMASKADAYDVEGASTLGKVTGITLSLNQNYDPKRLADGVTGYGDVLQGTPTFTGTITTLFTEGGLSEYSEDRSSHPLTLVSESAGGQRIEINLPNVVFNEIAHEVGSVNSLERQYNWTAFDTVGGDPVTVVVTNNVTTLPG